MENGILLVGTSLTKGMPMIVEIGAFFDVFVGVLMAGVLVFQIKTTVNPIIGNRNSLTKCLTMFFSGAIFMLTEISNVLECGWCASMRKFLYRAFAGILLLLAFVGVLLPLLPTVPFVLLAVFFLVKSSKRDLVRVKKIPYIGKILYPYIKRVAKWNTQQPSSST